MRRTCGKRARAAKKEALARNRVPRKKMKELSDTLTQCKLSLREAKADVRMEVVGSTEEDEGAL